MVFFSTLGGEGSHLEIGSLTLQPSLNWPQFLILLLLSSKVLGPRCVPPWLDSSQLLLGREELEVILPDAPPASCLCLSLLSSSGKVHSCEVAVVFIFTSMTNTRMGKGAKIKNVLVPPHKD